MNNQSSEKHSIFNLLITNEHTIMAVLAAIVGVAGGFGAIGFRHLSNSVRPVRTLADLSGLSIRVFPAVQAAFRMLGADVVYAPISETIPKLAD